MAKIVLVVLAAFVACALAAASIPPTPASYIVAFDVADSREPGVTTNFTYSINGPKNMVLQSMILNEEGHKIEFDAIIFDAEKSLVEFSYTNPNFPCEFACKAGQCCGQKPPATSNIVQAPCKCGPFPFALFLANATMTGACGAPFSGNNYETTVGAATIDYCFNGNTPVAIIENAEINGKITRTMTVTSWSTAVPRIVMPTGCKCYPTARKNLDLQRLRTLAASMGPFTIVH